jgi:signal transduction histidine kinase/ActR/RegA family two-component response regulator
MIRRSIGRLPIKAKLVAMLMLTSGVVLALASAGYVFWDYYELRRDLEGDVRAQATLALEQSEAALRFGDPKVAREILATLAGAPRLRTACLFDARGELFAAWHRPGTDDACPANPGSDGLVYRTTTIELVSTGYSNGSKFGSVFVQSAATALTARLRVQGLVTAALLALSLAMALFIASRLQVLVSGPILALSRTAGEVTARGDYSLRALKVNDDELGSLVDAFNGMLHRIEQRDAELREANRLKDEFLATLSHELRTPLNAILGWTRLLRSGAVPADGRDHALEKVERNAQAQVRLIEDLLEVSRITTGKLRLELKPCDLAAIVHAAVESLRVAAEGRHVAIQTTGLERRLPTLGDPDRLQQIVWNLLSNAVKFTPAGGRVFVSLERQGENDTLVVRDTGQGIDPKFLPSVFDAFRQADATSTRMHGGLGLGLSIARQLVELHGGAIDAFSEGADRGATFTVRLPVRNVSMTPATGEQAQRLPGRLRGVPVLVVEDEADTAEMLVAAFRDAGADVLAAPSAEVALDVARARRPVVLVSDIGMPVMDGYELMRRLAAEHGPDLPRVRIALTAYAGTRDRERSAAAGFQQHFAKPIDPLALVDAVATALEPHPTGKGR